MLKGLERDLQVALTQCIRAPDRGLERFPATRTT